MSNNKISNNAISNTNNCPICYYSIDSSEYVIIKHSKCKYYIHTECFKLYPKCIYCKADLNQTNDIPRRPDEYHLNYVKYI